MIAPPGLVEAAREALPGFRVLTGATVVGVPVGDAGFVREAATRIVDGATAARRLLINRLSLQESGYVMRVADGWPRVQAVFRAVPPQVAADAAAAHDEAMAADVARLFGEPDPRVMARYPLAAAIPLAHRLGGLQMPRARILSGVAFASGQVQVRRLLDSAFPPPPAAGRPTPSVHALPLFLPRLPGRPARGEDGLPVEGPQCHGSGRCHMPPAEGCERLMCPPCCALARGGAGGCAACARLADEAATALEAETPGITAEVRPAVEASARACGAPVAAAWQSFVLATRYHQPQRAATCALMGFKRDALTAALRRDGHLRELRLLEAASAPSAYAFLTAAPVAALRLTDATFTTFLRLRIGAPVLAPGSTRCKTRAGEDPRSCTLNGCARGSADAHALSCKCGGFGIASHDLVRAAIAGTLRGWSLGVAEETHALMARPGADKMDIIQHTAGVGRVPLCIDFCRHFGAGAAELAAAEHAKEVKYAKHYAIPVTLRGFAYDELGRTGPQADEVVSLLVTAGRRGPRGRRPPGRPGHRALGTLFLCSRARHGRAARLLRRAQP